MKKLGDKQREMLIELIDKTSDSTMHYLNINSLDAIPKDWSVTQVKGLIERSEDQSYIRVIRPDADKIDDWQITYTAIALEALARHEEKYGKA